MAGTTFNRQQWQEHSNAGHVFSGIVLLGGIWQIAAPFVLNFADNQMVMWNAIVSVLLLTLFAGLGIYGTGHWSRTALRTVDWLAAFVGLWLLISPFVLDYRAVESAFWSAIIVGTISLIAGVLAALAERSDRTLVA